MNTRSEEILCHTPGPWSCAQVWRGPETKVHAEVDGHHVALAEVFTMHEAGQKEANARLIVAAPEMFTALQAAQRRLEAIDDNSTEAIATRIVIGTALALAVQS